MTRLTEFSFLRTVSRWSMSIHLFRLIRWKKSGGVKGWKMMCVFSGKLIRIVKKLQQYVWSIMIRNWMQFCAFLWIIIKSSSHWPIFSRRKMVELLQTKTVQFFITKLVWQIWNLINLKKWIPWFRKSASPVHIQRPRVKKMTGYFIFIRVRMRYQVLYEDCCWKRFHWLRPVVWSFCFWLWHFQEFLQEKLKNWRKIWTG